METLSRDVVYDGKTYKLRTGKLFETGEYTDKGIPTVTTEDLDRIVANFKPLNISFSQSEGVSINLEHRNTPLDGHIGKVSRIWREGEVLMGDCIVPPFISDVLDETGTKGVSVEVDKELTNLSGLALTLNPRVAEAALFSDEDIMSKLFPKEKEVPETVTMSQEELDTLVTNKTKELMDKINFMASEQRKDKAEAKFKELLETGKVVPAQKDAAIALMTMETSNVVKFSDKEFSVGDAITTLLENAPVGVDFKARGEETDPNKEAVKFSTLSDFLAADSDERYDAVKSYQTENKIADFSEADKKFRESLGGK